MDSNICMSEWCNMVLSDTPYSLITHTFWVKPRGMCYEGVNCTMVLTHHAPCLYNTFCRCLHCTQPQPNCHSCGPTTTILLCLYNRHNPFTPLLHLLLHFIQYIHLKSQSNLCELTTTLNDAQLWSDYRSDPSTSTLSAGMYISCLRCIMLLTNRPQDLQKQSESVSSWIGHLIFALL